MFRRLLLEDWQNALVAIAFFLILTGFILILIRAVTMRKKDRDYMAGLPLQSDDDRREVNDKPSKQKPSK